MLKLEDGVFGISVPWRCHQKEIINATMACADTFVIMRTDGGKSLCSQLPASMPGKGVGIVISPLLSLISDQVYSLETIAPGGSAMLAGSATSEESGQVFRRMEDPRRSLRLVYVTLEKIIKSKLFVSTLEALNDAQ